MSGHEDDDEVVHHDAMYVSMDQPSLWVEDDPYMSAIVPAVKNRGVFISACGNFACAYNFGIIDYALHSLCAEASFCSVALHGLKCVCLRQTLDGPRRSFSPPSWHSPAWSSYACPLCAC